MIASLWAGEEFNPLEISHQVLVDANLEGHPFKAYLENTFQIVIDNTTRRHLGHLKYQNFVQQRTMGLFLTDHIRTVAGMILTKD